MEVTVFKEGGAVYFEGPRGRIFPPLSFIRPPPLGGYFQGLGGGLYKIWPPKSTLWNEDHSMQNASGVQVTLSAAPSINEQHQVEVPENSRVAICDHGTVFSFHN